MIFCSLCLLSVQALQPTANPIQRVNSTLGSLDTVPEGVVVSMPQVIQQPQPPQQQPTPQAQQYILVPIDATGKQITGNPNQLASLSIEEIEAQLRRTREAATGCAACLDNTVKVQCIALKFCPRTILTICVSPCSENQWHRYAASAKHRWVLQHA